MIGLREVYWDAVFHPKLSKLDFLQEGWRLEKSKNSSNYELQGVVLNEMKGVFSDSGSLFHSLQSQHFYKGTSYGFVSGGDPWQMPVSLSYQDLKDFHAKFYHISQAKIFLYGPSEIMEEQ